MSEMAEKCGVKQETVMGHIERMADRRGEMELEHLWPDAARLAVVGEAFEVCGDEFLKPAREYLGEGFSYDEIRLARIFLRREQGPAASSQSQLQ